LCREAIKKYPGSPGAVNCQGLIYRIEAKSLKLTREKVTVPGKSSRTLVDYRNIDKIYLRVVKTHRREILSKQRERTNKMVAYFTGKPAVKKWQVTLPDDNDYQSHSLEIKPEGLELGEYVLLAATNEDFNFSNNINCVAYSFFTVSNISYISRKRNDNGWEFYLMNRDTGQPLKNAAARALYRKYDWKARKYVDNKGKIYPADANGYLVISPDNADNASFYLEFTVGEDRLYSERTFSFYRPSRSRPKYVRTIFFSDRAIYRPGQTVYFKGIMLEVDSKDGEKNKILENYFKAKDKGEF